MNLCNQDKPLSSISDRTNNGCKITNNKHYTTVTYSSLHEHLVTEYEENKRSKFIQSQLSRRANKTVKLRTIHRRSDIAQLCVINDHSPLPVSPWTIADVRVLAILDVHAPARPCPHRKHITIGQLNQLRLIWHHTCTPHIVDIVALCCAQLILECVIVCGFESYRNVLVFNQPTQLILTG